VNTTHGMAVSSLLLVSAFAFFGTAAAADSPSKLRSEMTKVEKEYVELYNKLNTDREFDIVCKMQQPTGTRFPVRVCQPRYLINAAEVAATETMQSAMQSASATRDNVGQPTGGLGVASMGAAAPGQSAKQQAFFLHVADVQQKSPELQALGKKREELQVRYTEATQGK
jgi:hypothetical protein